MRQLTLQKPGELEWIEVPEPRIEAPTDVLVRPLAVTVCDVDPVIIDGRFPLPTPVALGHEFVAEVDEVGEGVHALRRGDPVIVPFQLSCGRCDRCRKGLTGHCRAVPSNSQYGFGPFGRDCGGAFSDLVRVPFAEAMLVPVPHGVHSESVACASDNLCDAWRSVGPQLASAPGANVLILGGIGSIPLYAVDIARALGASRVDYLDDDRQRLELAEALGAHLVEGPVPAKLDREYEISVDGTLLDPAGLGCALRSLAPGGICTGVTIHLQDPPIPYFDMYRIGAHFVTGRINARALMEPVLDLVQSGRIHPERITGAVLPWESAAEALSAPPLKPIFVREPRYSR